MVFRDRGQQSWEKGKKKTNKQKNNTPESVCTLGISTNSTAFISITTYANTTKEDTGFPHDFRWEIQQRLFKNHFHV